MPSVAATNFVENLYHIVLLRHGSSSEVDAWADLIIGDVQTSDQIQSGFITSQETQSDVLPIIRLYQAFLERAPDGAGLAGWVDAHRGGMSLDAIAVDFAQSAEFQHVHAGDGGVIGFVNSLYQVVLGRAEDAAGAQYWANYLILNGDSAAAQAAVVLAFANSPEFIGKSTGPDQAWLANAALTGTYQQGSSYGLVATLETPLLHGLWWIVSSPDVPGDHLVGLDGRYFPPGFYPLDAAKPTSFTFSDGFGQIHGFGVAGENQFALAKDYAASLVNGSAGAATLSSVTTDAIDTTGGHNVFFVNSPAASLTNIASVEAAIGAVKTVAGHDHDTFLVILNNAADSGFGVYEVKAYEATTAPLGTNPYDTINLLAVFDHGFTPASYHTPV